MSTLQSFCRIYVWFCRSDITCALHDTHISLLDFLKRPQIIEVVTWWSSIWLADYGLF